MSGKILSGGALMLVARWTLNVSGLVAAKIGLGRGEEKNPGQRNDQQNNHDNSDGLDHWSLRAVPKSRDERRRSTTRAAGIIPSSERLGGGLFAVDHPRRTEPIHQHAEALGPERLLDRHPHRAAVGECVEYAFRFGGIVDARGPRETFHLF